MAHHEVEPPAAEVPAAEVAEAKVLETWPWVMRVQCLNS